MKSRGWRAQTRRLLAKLDTAQQPLRTETLDLAQSADLPAPVRRFFRTALTDGQPLVRAMRLQHKGTLDLGVADERWRPFTSVQKVVVRRPGFVWDARVAFLPGLPVRVCDAYVAGEGILRAVLLGFLPLADLHGTNGVAADELLRFLAEAAWYPTALWPDDYLLWEPVDERSARVTLCDGDTKVNILFTFGESGLIETVRADARGRTVKGRSLPTPWQGRFWNYHNRGGMMVPLDAEVAWLLPTGPRPYWRAQVTSLDYLFA